MRTDPPATRILAHRACLDGPASVDENSLPALEGALARGFAVEFDVRGDSGRLTLTHDPAPWSEERDAARFLQAPSLGTGWRGVHALNVKELGSLELLVATIEQAGTADAFFLFDLELAGGGRDDIATLQARGFEVAHRLSDREGDFGECLDDERVTTLWLDEWDGPWVTPSLVTELVDAGKRTYFVSPELHRPQPPDGLMPRWRELAEAGVTGICTDYPILLEGSLA